MTKLILPSNFRSITIKRYDPVFSVKVYDDLLGIKIRSSICDLYLRDVNCSLCPFNQFVVQRTGCIELFRTILGEKLAFSDRLSGVFWFSYMSDKVIPQLEVIRNFFEYDVVWYKV